MDKETLSNYGWIVICVLVLAVMIALATPFGTFVSDAVKSTTQGLFDVNQNALNSTGLINIGDQSFGEGDNGGQGGAGDQGGTNDNETVAEGPGLYKVDGTFIPWATLVNDGTLTVADGVLSSPSSNMALEGKLVIDSSVTSIKAQGFYNCGRLDEIVLPSSVTTIGYEAFCGCGADIINIPSTMSKIDKGAFRRSGLSQITIPSTITSIEDNAFSYTKLSTITIPVSIKNIGYGIFSHTTSLKTIIYEGTVEQWNAKCNWDYIYNGECSCIQL